MKKVLFSLSLFLSIFSCDTGNDVDCDQALHSQFSNGFCDNCQLLPGNTVKINLTESDTSIFSFQLGDTLKFQFRDSSLNIDTVQFVCTKREIIEGQGRDNDFIDRCIYSINAGHLNVEFNPLEIGHEPIILNVIGSYNDGAFTLIFLNSKVSTLVNAIKNSNSKPYYTVFKFNDIEYYNVAQFKVKDSYNRDVSYYISKESNFCLFTRSDSTYYQRIN